MTEFEYSSDLEKEVFEYLDKLRESGETNMFGAGEYVQEEFKVSEREARRFLISWMKSFPKRHPK